MKTKSSTTPGPGRSRRGSASASRPPAWLGVFAALALGATAFGACAKGGTDFDTESEGGSGGGGGGTGATGAGGSSTTSTTSSTTTSTSTTSTTTTTTTTTSTTTTTTTTTTVVDCLNEPDFQTCADCYVMQDPAGYEAYAVLLLTACGCTGGATCLASCDTNDALDVCGPPPDPTIANQACYDCINNAAQLSDICVTDFQIACLNDIVCSSFIDEISLCPP